MNTYGRGPDVQMSIEAGNDMAMICHQTDSAEVALKALKNIANHTIDDSLKRVEKLKKKIVQSAAFERKLWDKYDEEVMQLRIDTLGEEAARRTDADTAENYSPVQDY